MYCDIWMLLRQKKMGKNFDFLIRHFFLIDRIIHSIAKKNIGRIWFIAFYKQVNIYQLWGMILLFEFTIVKIVIFQCFQPDY